MPNGIQKIFTDIAGKYEPINHILTFGFDMIWRKKTVQWALSYPGTKYLDICTGTGEVAVMLYSLAHKNISVYGTDFSETMLKAARSKESSQNITFIQADSDNLPFPDNFFDCITASFAARNLSSKVKQLESSLREFHRILKPGGRLINLETSQPEPKYLNNLFHFYIRFVIQPVGQLLSGSRSAYRYLSHSIIHFFSTDELSHIFAQTGFTNITVKRLLFGIAAIHVAEKPI